MAAQQQGNPPAVVTAQPGAAHAPAANGITAVHKNTFIQTVEGDISSFWKVWGNAALNCLIPCVSFATAAAENAVNATKINSNLKHVLDTAIETVGGDVSAILGAEAAGNSNIKDVIAAILKGNAMSLETFVQQVVDTKSPAFLNFVGSVLNKEASGLDAADKAALITTIQTSLSSEAHITLATINTAITNNISTAMHNFAQQTAGNVANAATQLLPVGSDAFKQFLANQTAKQTANFPADEKAFINAYLCTNAQPLVQMTQTDATNWVIAEFGGAIHAYQASLAPAASSATPMELSGGVHDAPSDAH